ncbi:amidohydrolase [Sinorhizobium medicae]|uniref:M20 metallopeptidase family protein n=1 Tax=Sinorhizobium TaxID=28105 RepID=UPI000FD823E4|nr:MULTISPECIES: M20 family metallopeptidase [Sinorhizobium]MDW9646138.1 amidohydrolase [Sinorhizobium meliloti]MDX0415020.1 amidohydrolase [Sinorhizobium medicae]MDX0476130.1 amidohydrolase [Sinorhizobium medicae]MQV83450.1 amidohydrolase [Sinorhizobium medicae]MQV89934.1 amidohydrolase [Sinorhizobium medicae]
MKILGNELLSEAERDAVVEMRHAMHRQPELSNNEWKTQKRLRDALESFGMTGAKTFHKTGLYIDIEGLAAGPNRSVALRGDIDALPIHENREDLSYQSQVPGLMHACGHDMHGSIALGTALAFHRMRKNFSGRVRVFFQPAEEAEPCGGRSVADEKLLDGFDAAVGFHVRTDIPAGSYGARAGAVTNSADQFELKIEGIMAHGAAPHSGVDAIAIAGAFINEVQKVVSREMPVSDRAIITIGTIHGGEATNIICPSVVMTGTIRTSTPERRELLVLRVREVAEGVAATHRGRAEFSYRSGEPPVVNDAAMVERFRQLVVETTGKDKFVERPPSSGSDDFGFYSSCVPSIYFWFGSREPGNESGVHTPTFGASDELLIPTTELAIRYCWELLRS